MRSRLSWLTLLLGAFFISFVSSPSFAQPEAYSLQQVIASLDSTSPVLAEARTDLARARAVFASSRAFPNPSLYATREGLHDAAQTTEQVVGVRQSIGFLWSLPSRYSSAKAAYDAARAGYTEARRELEARVILQTFEYDRLRQQSAVLDRVLFQAARLAEATAARRKVGDISPYDEQRFQLEHVQLQNRRQELLGDQQTALTGLVRLTGLPATQLENITLAAPVSPAFASEDEAVRHAVEHRPRLVQAERQSVAARRAHSAARWNQLPSLALLVGTKKLDPGSSGYYLEGELEIPLWNQRRRERNLARAEQEQVDVRYRMEQKAVEQEVRAAYRQLQLVERLQPPAETDLADSASVNMTRGVRLYLEGEMSALELVDALRTGIEAQDAALRLRNSLAVARAEMRRVAGLEPLEESR